MVIDLTIEVKTSNYKVITIAPDQPPVAEKEEKPKKEAKPKEPKKAVVIEELQCPKCKTHPLKKGNTAYGCANFKACGFKVPFEVYGKKLTDKQIADILSKGKTTKMKGWKLPGNETETEGKLVLNAGFELEIEKG
jgi:DNA topoisomerase-3